MPYKITWEEQGTYIQWYGECTPEENMQANGKIYGDSRFDLIRYQISDVLQADTNSFTDRNIEVIAKLELKASIWNKSLLVAHVTRDQKLIQQIRIYEDIMKDSNWEFGIFDSLNAARVWIEGRLTKKK